MGMPLLGVFFLPFCFYYWRDPLRQLELLFIGSAFSAGAVLVLGGFGVSPGLIPTIFFFAFVTLKLIFGTRYPGERLVLVVLWPFIAVCVLALISSLLMPRLFEGEILVWPQKAASFFTITPLEPNSGNITQDMYLLLCACMTVTAALYLTRTGANLKQLMNVYFASGLMVVFISLWQFAGNTFHVWFPSDFFLSNPNWAILTAETIGSFVRLTGPFSEPSGLAGYLAGSVGASGWIILNGHKGLLPRLLLGSGLAVMMLSTSTTGYASLAIMLGLATAYAILLGSARMKFRLIAGFAGAAALVVSVVVTVPVIAPGIAETAATIYHGTLNKQGTSSYNDRTSTDIDSLHAAEKSYGLGVGWGSNRSSSLLPGLLAGIGVWGVGGLLLFAWGVVRHVRIAHRVAISEDHRMIMHGAAGALLGTLFAAFLAGPTINSPDFYLMLALLIATAARARYEAQAARPGVVAGQVTGAVAGAGYAGGGLHQA